MNDDTWSHELARVAREEKQAEKARLDERWDRLSAGELSDEEEAELQALAAVSEEGRQTYEAFRPLGPEFQARMVETLRASNALAAAPAPVSNEPGPPRILPFLRWRAPAAGWLATAASAAAALILLLRAFIGSPALPMYAALELSDGMQKVRGEPARDLPVFAPGSPLKLRLVPDTAVSGKIAVQGFLARGEELRRWEEMPEPLVSEGGVVQVEGTIGRDIKIEPGLWTVWVVVGRPGKLPDADALRPHLGRDRAETRNWIARSAPIRVQRESG